MEDKMKQYRMLIEYQGEGDERPRCANPLWELTEGRFRSETKVRQAYEARAKSLNYKILTVEPWEQEG